MYPRAAAIQSASEDSVFPANSRISRKFGLIMSTPCSIAAARGAPDVSRKKFRAQLVRDGGGLRIEIIWYARRQAAASYDKAPASWRREPQGI